MTQSKFMYELMVACAEFSDDEKYRIMDDCNGFFYSKKNMGLTDEEIISQLPTPQEAVQMYSQGNSPFSEKSHTQVGKVTAAAVLLFVLMIPLCAIYEVVTLIFSILAFAVMLAVCVGAAFASVVSFGVSSLSLGFILLGVGGLFVTVACVLLSVAVAKGFGAAFAWFPRFMHSVLHGGKAKKKGAVA